MCRVNQESAQVRRVLALVEVTLMPRAVLALGDNFEDSSSQVDVGLTPFTRGTGSVNRT